MNNENEKTEKPQTSGTPLYGSELLEMHRRVLDRVGKMTKEEGFQSLVESGIYTPDGKLAKEYGG